MIENEILFGEKENMENRYKKLTWSFGDKRMSLNTVIIAQRNEMSNLNFVTLCPRPMDNLDVLKK